MARALNMREMKGSHDRADHRQVEAAKMIAAEHACNGEQTRQNGAKSTFNGVLDFQGRTQRLF
ncbi:hypothetical protein [Agrobacterium tumefaciens]|uniref:hypothetical protein n=1 Tax=Agrobacterium tumefaciens TaxID=358 RepID=UPI0013AEBB5D|nr:hypothetical protein [Agrobacterium tumefaciens]MDP9787871.1 hypothetical protein [Agrobacterium tumefaciens]MDP9854703.1 hypothetical protein [Agrobacterium tumefaciens]